MGKVWFGSITNKKQDKLGCVMLEIIKKIGWLGSVRNNKKRFGYVPLRQVKTNTNRLGQFQLGQK